MGISKLNPPAPPIIHCAACFGEVNNDDLYCARCRYPLKGTAMQQTTFIAEHNNVNVDFINYSKAIKKAGNALFYLSAVFAIGGIYDFFIIKDNPDVVLIVAPLFVLAIAFLLLGEFSKKKPLLCIVTGSGLYIVVHILAFIGDSGSITGGLVGNGIVIALLIKGIKSALDVEKIKKEHHIQ